MYIPLRPTLTPLILIEPNHALPFPLSRADAVLYEFSKNGIWKGISVLELVPGDKVVVPSYICRSALKPLFDFGLEVVFFRVSERLEPDREDLEAHLESGARALMFVHYFGFPQDVDYFANLRNRYGTILIEDCAHALLSTWGKVPLGSVGDVSIFCMRKFVPIWDGGAMLTNGPLGDDSAEDHPHTLKSVKGTLDLMVRHLEFRTGLRFSRIRNVLRMRRMVLSKSPAVDEKSRRISQYSRAISGPSRYLLAKFDWNSVYAKRRGNYTYLLELISDMPGITPLFGALSDGTCPQVLPVLVDNRDEVLAFLHRKGIEAGYWPELSDFVFEASCEVAEFVTKHMLILPIHQNLQEHHLDWCAEQVCAAVYARGKNRISLFSAAK